MASTKHNDKRKETWQGRMLPVTTQVKSTFKDDCPHKRSTHVFNEINTMVTETVCPSETGRGERNMSPMEIELLRTVGMINYNISVENMPNTKKGMSKLPVDKRAEDIDKYRRHKQRHHRKPMSGKCKTRKGWDSYNNKNLQIFGAISQGRTHRSSAEKTKSPPNANSESK